MFLRIMFLVKILSPYFEKVNFLLLTPSLPLKVGYHDPALFKELLKQKAAVYIAGGGTFFYIVQTQGSN